MSDRPTPETDREWDRLQMLPGGGYSSQVAGVKLAFGMARWASELERQRDEARELARELRDAMKAITPYIGYPSTPTDVVYQFKNAQTKAKKVLP